MKITSSLRTLLNILTYVCLGKSANVSRSPEVVNYLQFEAHKFAFYALFLSCQFQYKIISVHFAFSALQN